MPSLHFNLQPTPSNRPLLLLLVSATLCWLSNSSNPLDNIKPLLYLSRNTPSASEIFNTSYMIQMVKSFTLCGAWQSNNYMEDEAVGPLRQKQGIMMVNTSNTLSLNLIFIDSQYIDKKFIVVPLNFTVSANSLPEENITYEIKDQYVTYYKGHDFLAGELQDVMDCKISSLAIQIFKQENNSSVPFSRHPFEILRMEVQLYAPDCFIDLKSSTLVSCIQEREDQIWLYNMLNLLRLLENVYMSLIQFYEKDFNKALQLQLLLILCIDCYLFFFNLRFAQLLKSSFVISIPMAFLLLGLDCAVFFRDSKGWTVFCFLLTSVVAVNVLLAFSTELYWLLIPFVAIPLIDFLHCFVQNAPRKNEYLVYLGYLFPTWIILTYLKLYPHNFTKLAPEPQLIYTSGILMILGIAIKKVKRIIQTKLARREKEKYLENFSEVPCEEMCSICMEKLNTKSLTYSDNTEVELSPLNTAKPALCEVNVVLNKRSTGKVVKTPCNHRFHLKCLNIWFKTKEMCPYCRKELKEIARFLGVD